VIDTQTQHTARFFCMFETFQNIHNIHLCIHVLHMCVHTRAYVCTHREPLCCFLLESKHHFAIRTEWPGHVLHCRSWTQMRPQNCSFSQFASAPLPAVGRRPEGLPSPEALCPQRSRAWDRIFSNSKNGSSSAVESKVTEQGASASED
jgi:hypothetical protein